jgi:hypothetical protein
MPKDFVPPGVQWTIQWPKTAKLSGYLGAKFEDKDGKEHQKEHQTAKVSYVKPGTAVLTAVVQGPKGPLQDAEVITCEAETISPVIAPPILTSILIAFSAPTPLEPVFVPEPIPPSILRDVPLIVWAPPAVIKVGTALSDVQLNATSTTPGTFVYNPSVGDVPVQGTVALTTTFTPTDEVHYTTATATVNLVVEA